MSCYVCSQRVLLTWIAYICIFAVTGGCDNKQDTGTGTSEPMSRTRVLEPAFSADEIDGVEISILWQGPLDRPAPEVIFVVDEKSLSTTTDDESLLRLFRPTVVIASDEARRILDVLVPIYEANYEMSDNFGYAVGITTHQRHLEFALGPDRKSQAATLTAVSMKVAAEGRSAMAPMIAYVSN